MFAMVALAMNAQTQKLPVLKVIFDGAFNAKMDYLPGFMELTTCLLSLKHVVQLLSSTS